MINDILKLENQLSFSLYTLSREIIKLYRPYLDKLNLTYTQYITMLVMWDCESIALKELEERLHLDSGTLTPVLKRLKKINLIEKYRIEEDGRIVIVRITDKGRQMMDEALKIPNQVFCSSSITKEEVILLKDCVDIIIRKF